jgi:hypothetical protein
MAINLTYEEIANSFHILKKDFYSRPIAPFNFIEIRHPYKQGQRGLMSLSNQRRFWKGLSYVPGPLLPDETDYVAVIYVCGQNPNIKQYEFKIRADGAFLRKIPFEYNSQPISKWEKFISKFIQNLPTFGQYFRQVNRVALFKEELMRTFTEKFFHNSLTCCY